MWPFSKKQPSLPGLDGVTPEMVRVVGQALKSGMFGRTVDGLQNLATGLGTPADRTTFSRYTEVLNPNMAECDNTYRGSWLASKYVDIPANDMFREWVEFSWDGSGDDDRETSAVKDCLRVLQARSKFQEAKKWSRLYGGSSILVGCGTDRLDQPLDVAKVKKGDLRWIHALDRYRLLALASPITPDPASPNYGYPETYELAEVQGSVRIVHWTRVIRFDGHRIPYYKFRQNGYWHDSELLTVVKQLKSYEGTTGAIANLVFDANIDVMASGGLVESLAMDGGADKVTQRYQLGAVIKSLYKMIIIDKDTEEYSRQAYAFAGLAPIMEVARLDVAGAFDIPVTRLFGMSPAGMTATGESDIRNYYDHIGARQEDELRPQLERFFEIVLRSTLGGMPKGFELKFKPLWQTTDMERAQVLNTKATAYATLINAAVITPELAAKECHASGDFPQMEDSDVALAKELKGLAPMPAEPPPGVKPGEVPPAPNENKKQAEKSEVEKT